MRRNRGLALLIAVLFVLTGCGAGTPSKSETPSGSTSTTTPPATSTPAPKQEAPKKPQEVGLAIQDEPASLDPVKSIQLTTGQTLTYLSESLVYIDKDAKPKPWIAESWTVEDGGKIITFKIRSGKKFHDGTPLDADAVVFSFNRHLDPANKSVNRAQLGSLQKVEKVGTDQVKFTFEKPFAPFFVNLSSVYQGIVSPTAVKAKGDAFGREPVFSGPFKFDKWVAAQEIQLVRNPDHVEFRGDLTNKGAPKIEKLFVRIVPEEGTRVAALETGKIHFGDAPREEIDRFKNNPKYTFIEQKANNNLSMIELNPFLPPMDDVRVRKALAHSVKADEAGLAAYSGLSDVNPCPLPNGILGWDKALCEQHGYKYDLNKASQYLTEAGYKKNAAGKWEKDGKPLTFTFITYNLANGSKGGQVIQNNLEAAGWTVDYQMFDVATAIAKLKDKKHHGNYMWWSWWDPVFMSLVWKTPGWQQVFANPDLDKILIAAESELDVAKREKLVKDAMVWMLDNAGVVPLGTNWYVLVTRSDLVGLKLDGTNRPLLGDAEIK